MGILLAYDGRSGKNVAETAKNLCPLGAEYVVVEKKQTDNNTANHGDFYQSLRLTLDPQLLTFILGGVTFVVGAAVKKYVELWVEARFKQSRKEKTRSPQMLHDDLCRWLSLLLQDAALSAEKDIRSGMRLGGARLYINVPRDEKRPNASSGFVFWVTYQLDRDEPRVEADANSFYNHWFLPFENVFVPLIGHQSAKGKAEKIIVSAFLGQSQTDAPHWSVAAGIHGCLSCDGKVSNTSDEKFRKFLTKFPPFLFDPTTELLHWRSCKALTADAGVPVAMRELMVGVETCPLCLSL